MKQRPTRKNTRTEKRGQMRDVFEGMKPGEVREIADDILAINPHWIVLDPPEPIKKPRKTKPKKKSA